MTSEEKIAKLQVLFKQKEAVDNEILLIVAEQKKRQTKSKQARKVIKKMGRQKSPGLRKSDKPVRWYCLDCKEVFAINLPKLDVACPDCNSVQITYASVAKK